MFTYGKKEVKNREALERWFQDQAMKLENEYKTKKEQEDMVIRLKEEELRKEEESKELSKKAFKQWVKIKKREGAFKKKKKSDKEDRKMHHPHIKNEFKISIGPYSYSKDLRNFQNKYLKDTNNHSESRKSRGSKVSKGSKASSKQQNYEADSLQELSSIKNDVQPVHANEEEDE
jgi:hypothetical protein